MKERKYVGLEGMRLARKALKDDDKLLVTYRLTLDEIAKDEKASAYFKKKDIAGARLGERAGIEVAADLMEWSTMEIEGDKWIVEFPPGFAERVQAAAWDTDAGQLSETLTRSTRGPFWQLTRWHSDGGPWGHIDIDEFPQAFDTSPVAGGVSVAGLRQVVFNDGTTLTREGTTAMNPGNERLKRSLMR